MEIYRTLDHTFLVPHNPRSTAMANLLPTEAREKLRNACASIESQLNRPSDELDAAAINIRTILADLIEQMGPYLIQILLSFLTTEQTAKPTTA